MKNPNKRFSGKLLTIALAVVLCLGMAVPALAATGPNGEITGNEAKPAEVAITKTLKMPEGTTTPDVTFEFIFAKKALNENTTENDKALMPGIPEHIIPFSSGNNPAASGGIKTITKEEVIDLSGITFPYAGAYTYTLTEQQTLSAGSTDDDTETIVYSKAEYEISFYVKEGASGLYVYAIGTKIIKDQEGNNGSGAKVDPTPGTGGGLGGGGLLFINTYTKTTGGGNPIDPDNQVLVISNAVAGDFPDSGKYFDYKVTVTKPVLAGAAATYKAYILNASDAVIDPSPNANGATIQTDASQNKYIEFAADMLKTIKLKHGEKLVFTDVQIGATYVAEGQGAADYKLSAKITVNGTAISPDPEATGFGQNLSSGSRMVGETTPNSAAFTNTHKSIPVTGLIIDNFPFIMILILAASAFLVFVIVKSRKKQGYSSGN